MERIKVENNLTQKQSNILDPIHDTLDQDVFNGTTPKMAFFEYHLDHVREVFRQHNFNPYAFDFYLTGSLCTYQYSDKSDVDISIVCNADEFSEEDRADLIGIVIQSLDGSFFPRTKHQYQHFVQPVGVDIEDLFILGLRSAWDFQKEEWVLKPKRPSKDIHKEKPDWILAGVQVSDKINTLIDNHHYEDAKDMYKAIHKKRKEDQIDYGDYSEGNVIYKFLDNNGTFDRLRNIGQRIAFQRTAMVGEDFVDYYYDSVFGRSTFKQDTHLNSKGMPCSCGWGKKNLPSVRSFYKNLKSDDYRISKVIKVSEEESDKIKKIIQKTLDRQISPESKWGKRYPAQAQLFTLDDIVQLVDERNVKFLSGLINMYKKVIQQNDPKRNESSYFSILDNYSRGYGMNLERQRGLGSENSKTLQDSKEFFRRVWTGDYGKAKGFSDYISLDKNVLPEISNIFNEIDYFRTMLEMREDRQENLGEMFKWSRYFFDGDEELLENVDAKLVQQMNNYVSKKLTEMQQSKEIDYRFISTLTILDRLIKASSYNFGYEQKVKRETKNFQEFVPQFLDGTLLNMRPENLLDYLVDNKFNENNNLFARFADLLLYIKNSDIQRLVNEYQDLSFPTNFEGMETFSDIERKVSEIKSLAKEREEYKQLLRMYQEGQLSYDDNEPIFTFEVKKGNPEKALPGTWGVYRIETISDMELEGKLMNHCIGTDEYEHWQRRSQGLNTVFSVRDPNGIPWASIELDLDGQTIGQGFGRHNQDIRQNEQKILNAFFGQESFQRGSSMPDRYLVRTADGEEIEYDASSVEDALNQHKGFIEEVKSKEYEYDYSEKEIKGLKAVAAYGAGHEWFRKKEGERTGHYSPEDLPAPYEEEEEPEITYQEISASDYYGVGDLPDVSDVYGLQGLWEWFEESYHFAEFDFYIPESLREQSPDEYEDLEDLTTDEYGRYVRRQIDPFYWGGSLNQVYSLADQIVEHHKDEMNSSYDPESDNHEDFDYPTFVEIIKGFGAYAVLSSFKENANSATFASHLNSLDYYLQKKTVEYNTIGDKGAIAIINAIRLIIEPARSAELDGYINGTHSDLDIQEGEIYKATEIEFGSWDYSNEFDNSYIDVEIKSEKPPLINNQYSFNSDDRNYINYIQYAINLANEFYEELQNFDKTISGGPIQRTFEFTYPTRDSEVANNLLSLTEEAKREQYDLSNPEDVARKERIESQQDLMRWEQTVIPNLDQKGYDLSNIVTTIFKKSGINPDGSIENFRLLSHGGTRIRYNNINIYLNLTSQIVNMLEYIKSRVYVKNNPTDFPQYGQSQGQINFYEMPPEPTDEEYEKWLRGQEGILAPFPANSQSLSPSQGFING